MEYKKLVLGSLFAFAFAWSIPVAVIADPMNEAPQAERAADYSETEIEQFTRAYVQVEQIGQDLNDSLSEVQDPDEARQIQQEGHEKMHAAVQETGLDPDTYNSIAADINTDEALRSRVVEHLSRLQ